jgi:hypothetical protein
MIRVVFLKMNLGIYHTSIKTRVHYIGRLYLLPKIHERLSDVPGRPVISNCGTSTEKASDHHLKPIMKTGKSYIRDTGHFLEKLKEIGKVPENAFISYR